MYIVLLIVLDFSKFECLHTQSLVNHSLQQKSLLCAQIHSSTQLTHAQNSIKMHILHIMDVLLYSGKRLAKYGFIHRLGNTVSCLLYMQERDLDSAIIIALNVTSIYKMEI